MKKRIIVVVLTLVMFSSITVDACPRAGINLQQTRWTTEKKPPISGLSLQMYNTLKGVN